MLFNDEVLTEAQIDEIERYRKSFGDKWADDALLQRRARNYVERLLVRTENKVTKPFRCCTEGFETYARKDGLRITAHDIHAVNHLSDGQVNEVYGDFGQLTMKRHWFCDSGD